MLYDDSKVNSCSYYYQVRSADESRASHMRHARVYIAACRPMPRIDRSGESEQVNLVACFISAADNDLARSPAHYIIF
jgi:hypothetical protein